MTAPTTEPTAPLSAGWTYAPAPESAAVAAVKDRYLPFVDGTFVEGHGDDAETFNPGTAEVLATVSQSTTDDVDTAVAAARRAYTDVWSPMSGAERGRYLFRIARGLAERARELAVLECLDNGKPIRETRDFDVPTAAQHFFYHAGWADKLGHLGLGPAPRSLGVAAQVIPWNFPLLMAAWKLGPARGRRAAPSSSSRPSTTPLSGPASWASSWLEAGLPARRGQHRHRRFGDAGRGAGRATPTSTRSPSPVRPPSGAGSSAPSPGRGGG